MWQYKQTVTGCKDFVFSLLFCSFTAGIGGLESHVIKSATLSTTLACPAFTELQLDVAPILRVALEPKHASKNFYTVYNQEIINSRHFVSFFS